MYRRFLALVAVLALLLGLAAFPSAQVALAAKSAPAATPAASSDAGPSVAVVTPGIEWASSSGSSTGKPVVANGAVYAVSADDVVRAYSVTCASSGHLCTPLWKSAETNLIASGPLSVAVGGGAVFLTSNKGDYGVNSLSAYAEGCRGDGGVCTPLWTATIGWGGTSPTFSEGVVYVATEYGVLYAFNASCRSDGGACSPLWTGDGIATPTVSGSVVYSGANAYAVGCRSDGGNCSRLWHGTTGGSGDLDTQAVVANGVVYVGADNSNLYAFSEGCATGDGACSPVWVGVTGADSYFGLQPTPAVSGGVVYMAARNNYLFAFQVGCSSGGNSCSPLWTGLIGNPSSPVVSNGIVYVGGNALRAFAVGCGSGGATCLPLWQKDGAGEDPTISSGVVYVGGDNDWFYALGANGLDHLTISPAHAGIPFGTSQTYSVKGISTSGSDLGNFSGLASFTLQEYGVGLHSCSGNVCTPMAATDGTAEASYGYLSVSADLHVGVTYHPISPKRILDTRPTAGSVVNIGLSGKFNAGQTRMIWVNNQRYVGGGSSVAVPPTAVAITGNLTVVKPSAAGSLSLVPHDSDMTTVAISFYSGDVRANNVTIGLNGGALDCAYNAPSGNVDVLLDVTGYFAPDIANTYKAIAPGRVLDTRPTSGGHANIGLSGKFKTGVVRTLSVAGVKAQGWSSALVPAGATAVTGNLTVTNPTTAGFASLGPTMVSLPKTSTINVKAAGQNVANGVTVALNAGKLQAVWHGSTSSSTADLLFDVTGYFIAGAGGLSFHPLEPYRVLNTLTGTGLGGKFNSGVKRTMTVSSIYHGSVPVLAPGISGNLTVVNPGAGGWAFAGPSISGTPTSSTVNTTAHVTAGNGLDVALNSSKLDLIWVGGTSTTDMVLDVTGFWW